MDEKKILAICQSGGEFEKNKDGSLSYNGGEAYVIDINQETKLSEFKSEVAEMFGYRPGNIILKYFLPGNRKTLITISKDRDLNRMVNFLDDSATVDVFVINEDASARNILSNMPARNRLSNTPARNSVSNTPARRSSRIAALESATPRGPPVPVNVVIDVANGMIDVDPNEEHPIECSLTVVDERIKARQWEDLITGVNQRFNTFSELRESLHKYSIAHGFSYRYKKNDNHRVSAKCKSPGCSWRLYASKLKTTNLICIKKMNNEHTCEGGSAGVAARATRGWVGSIIKEKLKVHPDYKPKDIAEDMKKEYGIKLNYSQAWRAKEVAMEQLQGSYKEAFNQLPSFCNKIKETNPGSIVTLCTKEDSSFHRLFISFHASVSGFEKGCRPLIFLDNAILNSKFQGMLLAAVAADGDDGVFPIAFAIVDAETEENWHWFLLQLKSAISTSHQITFVADFQNGLRKLLPEVFDKCNHSFCLRYLADKLNKDLKGQFSHEARRFMVNDFYSAAYAPNLEAFQRAGENMKSISPEAYNWMIRSEPERWANAFFRGARYNLLMSNFGQQFYSWVSEAHELPITQMIDALRLKMMETINARRVASNRWTAKLTPSKEEKLQNEASIATTLQVLLSQGNTFEVRGASIDVVDIERWECSCKGWQLTGLPCAHAIAVFECIGRSPYDYCSRYLTVESYKLTYAESIHPFPEVEGEEEGEQADDGIIVTPPPIKRKIGRSKVKRLETDDLKRQIQCRKCQGLGHNKRTCKT